MASRYTPRRGDVRDPGPSENPDAGNADGQSDDMEGAQADSTHDADAQTEQGPIVSPTSENAGSRPTRLPKVVKTKPNEQGDYADDGINREAGSGEPFHDPEDDR